MIQLKTILLPTDGSECSAKAATYALSFAKQYGARIVALDRDPAGLDADGFALDRRSAIPGRRV